MIDERPPQDPEAPGTRVGVQRLELDQREADGVEHAILAAPSLDDVAEALGSLDQDRHTELTLVDGGGAYLTVGGGRGRYHVYVGAYDHDDCVILQSPDAGDGHEDLVVDGRLTRYAAHDVVDLDIAAEAVLEFFRSARPHPDLTWRSG